MNFEQIPYIEPSTNDDVDVRRGRDRALSWIRESPSGIVYGIVWFDAKTQTFETRERYNLDHAMKSVSVCTLAMTVTSLFASPTCAFWSSPTFQTSRTALSARNNEACPLLPPPDDPSSTFEAAMGWFWSPQRDFDDIPGVRATVVGYSGSKDPRNNVNPTYTNIQDCT